MTNKAKARKCCPHIAGAPFQLMTGPRQVIGVPLLCCWHGESSIKYIGIEEPGHGPHISHQPAPASGALVLPSPGQVQGHA